MATDSAIILLWCPDQRGIVAKVTQFLAERDGNILDLDEHVDQEDGSLFMRVQWDLDGFQVPRGEVHRAFSTLAADLGMKWSVHFSSEVLRMALFVSKDAHCLYDILARYESGEWKISIPLIISNHEALAPVAGRFGIDFKCFPVSKENKPEQEQKELALLQEYKIDFIVLARYMQILSPEFVGEFENRIINIHHSFLPAFPGARPYHSAHRRGVKIIGATSHYVTGELDAGPIIEQDIARVSHKDSVDDFIRKGKDLEKIVLARAIWNHVQRRTLVYGNRTVILT